MNNSELLLAISVADTECSECPFRDIEHKQDGSDCYWCHMVEAATLHCERRK